MEIKNKADVFTGEDLLTEAEISMILDTFMYLDYKGAKDGATLGSIIQNLEDHPDYGGGGAYFGQYTVLKEAVKYQEISNLVIGNQSINKGYDTGTAACTFYNARNETLYVAYRGTGDGEWPDNGLGLTRAATPQQEQALCYFEEVAAELEEKGSLTLSDENGQKEWEGRVGRMIVTGHSKGGNKAQYVTMESKYGYLIDACYSVDGQGFSEMAVEHWKKQYGQQGYEERRQKLYGIYGENDYVNVLGYTIVPEEHVRYIKTPVEKENFAGYHDIKYMFASLQYDQETGEYITVFHGRKNRDVTGRGRLGDYAADLSEKVMDLPPSQRDGCAAVVMQIMESMEGSRTGLNGERLSFSDLIDFVRSGLPMIWQSLTFGGAGGKLIVSVVNEPILENQVRGCEELRVDYRSLGELSQRLETAADELENRIREMELLAGSLGEILHTHVFYCSGLNAAAGRLDELRLKLSKKAQLLLELAEAYKSWDVKTSEAAGGAVDFFDVIG